MTTITLADRVKETALAVTGSGAITLQSSSAGAQASFASFASALSSGQVTWYGVVDQVTGAWEVRQGTFTAGTSPTLSRDSLFSSSNAGSAVTFAGNSCDVFITVPASQIATVAGTAPSLAGVSPLGGI